MEHAHPSYAHTLFPNVIQCQDQFEPKIYSQIQHTNA